MWLTELQLIKALILLLTLGISFPSYADIKVFELEFRQADELVRVISPLLPGNTKISADGQKLIVSGSTSSIHEVRALLRKLDVPLTRYRISVKINVPKLVAQALIAPSGRTERVLSTQQDISTYKTLVTAGVPATITQSQQMLLVLSGFLSQESAQLTLSSGGSAISEQRDYQSQGGQLGYRELRSGIIVTLHPAGEHMVSIDIQQQRSQGKNHYEAEVTTGTTSLDIPLGQWIAISQLSQGQVNRYSDDDTVKFTTTNISDTVSLVRIDKLD